MNQKGQPKRLRSNYFTIAPTRNYPESDYFYNKEAIELAQNYLTWRKHHAIVKDERFLTSLRYIIFYKYQGDIQMDHVKDLHKANLTLIRFFKLIHATPICIFDTKLNRIVVKYKSTF